MIEKWEDVPKDVYNAAIEMDAPYKPLGILEDYFITIGSLYERLRDEENLCRRNRAPLDCGERQRPCS